MVAELSWQDGFADPAVPQIVLMEQKVDASDYPHDLKLGPQNLLFRRTGEGALDWINGLERGAPLPAGDSASGLRNASAPDAQGARTGG